MNPKTNLPLTAGLLLNLVRLLVLNSGAERWLRENWNLPPWSWHFVGGAACALMLIGLVRLALGEEGCARLRAWKRKLFSNLN